MQDKTEKKSKHKKVVFVTNIYNHHQSEVASELYRLTKGKYLFATTEIMSDERRNMGWGREEIPPYVLQAEQSDEKRETLQKEIDEADYVLAGGKYFGSLLKTRRKKGKINFHYFERIFRKEPPKWQMPLRIIKNWWRFGRYQNEYLLCASAFAARDFTKTKVFSDKTYKWGYFTKVKKYNLEELFSGKRKNDTVSLIWVGRLIELKHPEVSVLAAKRLAQEGYTFKLNIIGNGEMENQLHSMILEYGLQEYVNMPGAMTPEQVRLYMEKSDIFLFTSDFREGWGAVLNEAMNSACAVIASHAIGSVPFLIKNGENGMIYHNDDQEEFYSDIKQLFDNPGLRIRLGTSAYQTIYNLWNPQIAAERFLIFAEEIEKHGSCDLFSDGPCSRADILGNNWFGK